MFTNFHYLSTEQLKDPAIEELPLGQARSWPKRPNHFHEVVHHERLLPCQEWCELVTNCFVPRCAKMCQDGLLKKSVSHFFQRLCAQCFARVQCGHAEVKQRRQSLRAPGQVLGLRQVPAWYRHASNSRRWFMATGVQNCTGSRISAMLIPNK